MPARLVVILKSAWPRALLRAHLRAHGWDVVTATRVSEAVRISRRARAEPARAVLIEAAQLEERTAPEVLSELLTLHDAPQLIVLGRLRDASSHDAIVVERPLRPERLLAVVESLRRTASDGNEKPAAAPKMDARTHPGPALASP